MLKKHKFSAEGSGRPRQAHLAGQLLQTDKPIQTLRLSREKADSHQPHQHSIVWMSFGKTPKAKAATHWRKKP
ncbi:hypothetical protein MHYP_G00098730 [Metynnis hypsauchen]